MQEMKFIKEKDVRNSVEFDTLHQQSVWHV